MNDLAEYISTQCSEYEDLQNRHLNLLKAELLPDISQMTLERKAASKNLRSAIDEFMETVGQPKATTDPEQLKQLKHRLGLILGVDQTIGVEIKKHKNQLEKSLKHLKHGKTALDSYRPLGGQSKNRPRLISINR